jgi:adenylylsulfate kinase
LEHYGNRILELHLSENNASYDDHFLVYSDSIQYMIIKEYADIINTNSINVVIESRNSSMEELFKCYFIINEALTVHASRFTPHDSRLTSHASRFTPHASRLTSHASHLTPHDVIWHDSYIERPDRNRLNSHKSGLIWLTGLSAAGKSTIAHAVERELFNRGIRTYALDGDNVRHGLNANLGFSPGDRKENIRRIAEVSKLMADAGIFVLAAFISPYKEDRDAVRRLFSGDNFAEIYVKCSIEECERRDPKGQYKKARAGIIKNYTGISAPYEEPDNPDLVIDTEALTVEDSVREVMAFLTKKILKT